MRPVVFAVAALALVAVAPLAPVTEATTVHSCTLPKTLYFQVTSCTIDVFVGYRVLAVVEFHNAEVGAVGVEFLNLEALMVDNQPPIYAVCGPGYVIAVCAGGYVISPRPGQYQITARPLITDPGAGNPGVTFKVLVD